MPCLSREFVAVLHNMSGLMIGAICAIRPLPFCTIHVGGICLQTK
jgi:hypothetical protein